MMLTGRVLSCFVFAIFFTLLSDGQVVHACSFDAAEIGDRGRRMGGAMTAVADDLMVALYYNPAGLAQLDGMNVSSGMIYISNPARYRSPNGYRKENILDFQIPYFGFSTDKYGPLNLGLGFYNTMGQGYKFRKDKSFGINGDIESGIGGIQLNPCMAIEIKPGFLVGIEPNIAYMKSEINQPTPQGYSRIESDGFGYGVTLGFLYKPNARMSIGLSWRSPMKVTQKGDGKMGKIEDRLRIKLCWPQMLSLGLAYRYSSRSIISLDIKWSEWSYFDHSKLDYERMNALNTPFARHTRDGIRIKLGIERKIGAGLKLGCGYVYNPYCISDRYISPAILDFTYHGIFLGVGKKMNNFSIDSTFCYTIYESRRISTSSVGYPGKYNGYGIFPSLTIS